MAHIGYTRSLFNYRAAIYGSDCAPSFKEKIEAEQNKCTWLITSCPCLTETGTCLAEADLISLSVWAKQLAGI